MNKMLLDMMKANLKENNGTVVYDKESYDGFVRILDGFQEVVNWFTTSRKYGVKFEEDKVTFFTKNHSQFQKQVIVSIAVATQYEVGGWENAIMDNVIEELPPVSAMAETIYEEVAGKYGKNEIRFLTKKWLMDEIVREIHKEMGVAL